jgi:2-keto-4-pentenoate hydratase/2-oxohepta-3-ene-1,7-dioic acid hydratase in catechol pathway
MIDAEATRRDIAADGFAWMPRSAWSTPPELQPHWRRLCQDWDHLEEDRYLERGARFRLRRYGRYYWSPSDGAFEPLPHAPYFQPPGENSYAGGIDRTFAPLLPDSVFNPLLHALVESTFDCLPLAQDRQDKTWEVRIHQIRIVATPSAPGLPAPEGIHQDGTDFLTLHMVCRHNVEGAETTLYDRSRNPIWRHTLRDPWDSLILEDPRLFHGVTAARSADGTTPGTRDLLGVDFIYSPGLERPAARPGKIICVGLNYHSHLAEIGEPRSRYPILFLKPASSVIRHRQPIILPRVSGQVDYEGELAVIIGRRAKNVPEDDALSYVAGYSCANDVSAHDIEFRTSQWTSGKMLDTFCPLGPVVTPAYKVRDPGCLRLRTKLDGHTVQDASTADMIFSVPSLISYISSLSTLEPGDVILTGTPAGIGCNQKPQVFLRPGDEITVEIDHVGVLTNPVVAEEGT